MKKILFVNPFGIGDVIFTMASVQRVREAYPGALIGFVGNERTRDFLQLCPAVDRVHVFDRGRLRSLWTASPLRSLRELKSLLDEIRREKYEVLADFSLGREFSLAAMLLGIRRRFGLDYKNRGVFLTGKKKIHSYEKTPVAQQQIDFLHESKILPDTRMPASIEIRVSPGGAESAQPILAVAPGGGRSWGRDAFYKQWNPENFSAAVRALMSSHPGFRVVVLGDEAEAGLLESVRAGIGAVDCTVMAGEPMEKVCAVLKRAKLLLCNDGGLMHLAHALGTKAVAVFGPVDEKVYGPYGGPAPARVIAETVPCRPCYQNFHFPPCPHNRRCLTGVFPDKVIEAARKIL